MTIQIRGTDIHGSGAYKAPRGNNTHNGIDIIHTPTEPVFAFVPGRVTKIGYPYLQGVNPYEVGSEEYIKFQAKKALRYVQVTDEKGFDARYFYVNPSVGTGRSINSGDEIGVAQGLDNIYPDITEHFHFEVLRMVCGKKVFSDPEQYLDAYS